LLDHGAQRPELHTSQAWLARAAHGEWPLQGVLVLATALLLKDRKALASAVKPEFLLFRQEAPSCLPIIPRHCARSSSPNSRGLPIASRRASSIPAE
jgi:hypothetical protein